MERIIDNNREAHEWLLIAVTICSLLTFKKIRRLERYKKKLERNFKYFDL
ncbi:hypothetical protein H8S33_14220 [Ornithinibacillus sp. BX22]|uniref:Uncharacterized protein n=2 Tax=Ornithinibacillus TaxID=484508 RepID=A0A923L7L1_9BACI|nr:MULTISPECIES: hypothetical protein [Ornithinibacillus]MBC5637948.1 hypothetical protein [Ornithinibacillus hominis]MBS3681838.1 hypothetical protein [Ornithinibacillus massiliensis]